MKIAMVASEINPLAKSGGLADVVYALSKEIVKKGEEVICVMPYYASVNKALKGRPVERVGGFLVYLSWRRGMADIYKTEIDGITYYLIGNDEYFNRPQLYGYDDDGERFAFFSLAARGLFEFIKYRPDVIHIHDWQTGMIPVLVKIQNRHNAFFSNVKFVLTIHNPAFKGYLAPNALGDLYNLPMSLYDDGSTRFENMVSTLKAGIVYSNKITTVSPTHRNELLTREGSFGLDGVMWTREFDFCGFLNGIDTEEFNPGTDAYIPHHFSIKDFSKGKKANRDALFEECGMKDHGGPTFGLVSRLTFQKGIDLVADVLPELLDRGAHFVLCGSGEYGLEQRMEQLRKAYPEQVGIYIGYSNERAHKVYASSDYFLMPSSFEPCGIGQMVAQAYGTLPIVRYTGGLADTVAGYKDVPDDKCTGIGFKDYDIGGLRYACNLAMELYEKPKLFKAIQKQCLEKDNSWAVSAELYLGLYKSICA
ncbi:MAG: glycogen synthase [Bacillota bacterium]|nr:glycogen synthase [Bacillota bacterium]